MGLHHSGVEILGKEYSFASGGGIFDSSPKEAPGMYVFYKYLQNVVYILFLLHKFADWFVILSSHKDNTYIVLYI